MSRLDMELRQSQSVERLPRLESLVDELRQDQAKLRASEAQWLSIVQNSPDFIALVDRNLRLIYLNRSAPEQNLDEMFGTVLLDYIRPEYHDLVKGLNESVFMTGLPTQYEIPGYGPNGTTVWYACRLGPVTVDGQVVFAVHTVRDVTKRRLAEDALRESEQKHRLLLNALPDVILRVHRDGACLEFRPAKGGDHAGLQSNAVGRSLAELLPDHIIDKALVCFSLVLAEDGPQRFEYQYDADGTLRDYEARLMPGGDDEVLIIVHDITQRCQAERAALASERRYRRLVERAPICMIQVDLTTPEPQIMTANRRAELIYGAPAATIQSWRLADLFAARSANDLSTMIARVADGQMVTMESWHARADGTAFPVRISATSGIESADEPLIFTVEEITAEKQRRSEVEALEDERRRIAREIHDGLAQDLSALHLKVSLWHELLDNDPGQLHVELDELSSVLKEGIGEVRRSIFALRPLALDDLGFLPAINQLLVSLGNLYSLYPRFQVTGPMEQLDPTFELPLFRVIQESINNVGQHAQATSVSVALELEKAHAVTLTIVDDGVGFYRNEEWPRMKHGHVGIQHMRERVESLGGSFSIESEVGRGTQVQAVLPVSTGCRAAPD